jgi:hemin uptake protein HemP
MDSTPDDEDPNDSYDRNQDSSGRERRLTMVANCLESRDLFVGTRKVVIRHGRNAYHLRLTAQNKLILTK